MEVFPGRRSWLKFLTVDFIYTPPETFDKVLITEVFY